MKRKIKKAIFDFPFLKESVSFMFPSQCSCAVDGAPSHDRRVLRLKEKSLAFCHPLNVFCSLSRGFCLFLLFSLFGHVSRIWGLVGVAVDSPVCEPLVDVMDMVVWLSGQSSRLQISRSLVQFRVEVMVYVHDVVKQSDHSDDQYYEVNQNFNQNDYKKFS